MTKSKKHKLTKNYMDKIIKLANRSRKNRIFFDHLIRELAICLNVGDTSINRKQLAPSYVNHSLAGTVAEDENYFQLNRDTGCLFQPLENILPVAILDALDAMLQQAPPELKGSCSRKLITDYLTQCTDLTDCHYSALNMMQSIH